MTMPFDEAPPDVRIEMAVRAFTQGLVYYADLICQEAIEHHAATPPVYEVLATIAEAIGQPGRAALYWREHAAIAGTWPVLKDRVAQLEAIEAEQGRPRPTESRYLVIRAWGHGFFSDVSHALAGLLLAEATCRTPVIWWDRHSLFCDDGVTNCWSRFFHPVNGVALPDLLGKGHSYYPPKWNEANLLQPEVNYAEGEWSRFPFLGHFNRTESVCVLDYYAAVVNLRPWLPLWHPLEGQTIDAILRALVKKYLVPADPIREEADAFTRGRFGGRPMVALHVRGTDKHTEDPGLPARTAALPGIVSRLFEAHPDAGLFLLTDTAAVRDQYESLFPGRVVTTECVRGHGVQGIHLAKDAPRERLGREVLLDALIAARCDWFVASASSNVAVMIHAMKDWADDRVTLLGPKFSHGRFRGLHHWV